MQENWIQTYGRYDVIFGQSTGQKICEQGTDKSRGRIGFRRFHGSKSVGGRRNTLFLPTKECQRSGDTFGAQQVHELQSTVDFPFV